MKKVIKYFAAIILYTALLGLVSPFLDMVNVLETYKRADHWIICFVSVFIVYNISIYFNKRNSRKFYYCINVPLVTIVFVTVFFAFIAMLAMTSVIEGITVKIGLITVSALACLLIIYAFAYRGVAVYEKGKIRIFKFKIITYSADKIDAVRFEYKGRKCVVHIIVCGNDNVFNLPAGSAKLCEKRLSLLN